MQSEGFPFIVWGSGGWTLFASSWSSRRFSRRFAAKPRSFCCAVSSFCLSSGVAVSMGEAAKRGLFCCARVALSMGEAATPQSRLEFLLCASFE